MMHRLLKIVGWTVCGILSSVVVAAAYYFLFSLVISTDVEKSLKKDIAQLEKDIPRTRFYADLLQDEIVYLEERDRNIYKSVFKADPPSISKVIDALNRPDAISAGRTIVTDNYNHALELMHRAGKVESGWREAYDTLEAGNFRLPPAIFPINELNPNRIGASTGMKMNPFYKVQVPHDGLDIIAPPETPVLATAPGYVSLVRKSEGGKGNLVEITHIGGYRTRYAHLSKIFVGKGQYVRTGKIIATVGDSGRSFTTHLHYEVEKDGNILDPCNFMYASLSPGEYLNMLIMSSLSGQSQD